MGNGKVLGALGCGVFENKQTHENKENLIAALNAVLQEPEFQGVFKHISIGVTGQKLAREIGEGIKKIVTPAPAPPE